VAGAKALRANEELCSRGVQTIGSGFIISPEKAEQLGLSHIEGLEKHVRQYRNGRDLTGKPRGVMVIDLFGLGESEVRDRFPEVYQHVFETVKPERDQNRRKSYRERWWIHGEPRGNFRPALERLTRYIATVETAKHRFFVFLDKSILPDNMLVNVALEDAYFLGVLSSRVHVAWALAAGGTLEDRPRYNKTRCFETFPFPAASEAQQAPIRDLAERLDAHRKRQQAQHPSLTLTDLYNVLAMERAGEALDDKARRIHQQGLVGILRQLHEELDAAVAAAYGWPADLPEAEILQRLVDLNAERAAEEAQGQVRWLRPTYQAPDAVGATGGSPQQGTLDVAPDPVAVATATEDRPWPKELPQQAAALRDVLASLPAPADVKAIAGAFQGRRTTKRLAEVGRLLETLAALGQVSEEGGMWGG
jgi:hypothetical protein